MSWFEIKDKMLLSPKTEWRYELYGFYHQGRGDACWRTGLAVLCGIGEDYPELIEGLKEMMERRVRYLGEVLPTIKGKYKYLHPRNTFSRDQWIAGLAGLHEHDPGHVRKNLKIPFVLSRRYGWRLDVLFWSLYLKYERKIFKRLYIAFAKFHLLFPIEFGYVLHLKCLMAYKVPDKNLNKSLLKKIPSWNLGLRAMVGGAILPSEVNSYKAKPLYQWQMNNWHAPSEYLDEDDPLALDKRVLLHCWNNKPKYN